MCLASLKSLRFHLSDDGNSSDVIEEEGKTLIEYLAIAW